MIRVSKRDWRGDTTYLQIRIEIVPVLVSVYWTQSKEEVGILSNLKRSRKWSAGQSLVYKSNEITVLASEFGSVLRQ